MDIKQTILWIIFTFSLFFIWNNWQHHVNQSSSFQQETLSQSPIKPDQAGIPRATPPAASITSPSPLHITDSANTQADIITITTDVMKVDIDTLGGDIRRLELLQHRDTIDPKKNFILFDISPTRTYLAQTGLIGGNYPNHKTLFTAKPGVRHIENHDMVSLELVTTQNGVTLTKTFVFQRGNYAINIKHKVVNGNSTPITPSLYLQLVRDGNSPEGEQFFVHTFTGGAVYTTENKYEKIPFEKIKESRADHIQLAHDGWFAMVQHYFVSAFIPKSHEPRTVYTETITPNLYSLGNIFSLGTLAPGESVITEAHLFSGPQNADLLEVAAPGLDLVRDYGILAIIAKPIFWLMDQIHKWLGNWGWTIIALTVLIKLVFFPLSATSYRSMAKMKAVAPKMQSIRERFKEEPQKLHQAVLELYKTEKINPLGGCLPILIQIPVFISLYWVLLASVEMRDAPWVGWINDLTSPDPFYILPIVMAISMFIQTKLNPTPPDPLQAKLMMWMPLIFSIMFFFFPAGLVLYWLTNNILSITQQWIITKKTSEKK